MGWLKKTKTNKQTFDLIMALGQGHVYFSLESKIWVNALTATSVALGMHILKQWNYYENICRL